MLVLIFCILQRQKIKVHRKNTEIMNDNKECLLLDPLIRAHITYKAVYNIPDCIPLFFTSVGYTHCRKLGTNVAPCKHYGVHTRGEGKVT